MSELLEAYGSPRNRKRAVYPFRWLLTDGVWEIPGFDGLHRNQSGDLRVTELRDRRVKGGFTREVHALLKSKPVLVAEAAYLILSRHFPPSLHGDVLEAVGLAPGSPTWESQEAMPRRGRPVREYLPRDPRFRREVLAAYDDRCAVCEHDILFGNRVLGLEAAHIQWHSHEGRDEVPNGLALCSLHHKALDYRALGLDPRPGGFQILISSRVGGESRSTKQLLDYRGKPLRPPLHPSNTPAPSCVAWHRNQVFHP